MWPFDDIGGALGDQFSSMVGGAFEAAMKAIWDAALAVLRTAFQLADQFSVFSVSTTTGPLKVLWPMMLWISGVMAIGLFSWQLIMTNLRGGRGFMRLITGPVQYGIALAATVGMVATFLAAVDGLTDGILSYGLQSSNFTEALNHTSFSEGAGNGVKGVVLGICAIVGVIPAAVGYVLEMLFRQAAILMLAAVVPVAAAGLLARVSSPWFWKTVRWLLAAIAMKPALALALYLGVAIAGGAQGLAGLLAGVGVLLISLFAPFVLFRLFAFVDPQSDPAGAFRDFLSGEGIDSYGPGNPALVAASAPTEDAHADRFDEAIAAHGNDSLNESGVGESRGPDTSGGGEATDDGQRSGSTAPPPANAGQVVASSRSGGRDGGEQGDDPPPAEPPRDGGNPPGPDSSGPRGGGSNGPRPGGGGGGAAAAEEVAVIPP